MKGNLPYQEADPAHTHYQYLENLATGYWYSEVLFTAIDLDLFRYISSQGRGVDALSQTLACDTLALKRLLVALHQLKLVGYRAGIWFSHQLAARYLDSSSPDYLGAFLLYRRAMQPAWQGLTRSVAADSSSPRPAFSPADTDDYETRNRRYVNALDALACQKALEIVPLLGRKSWRPRILDIGGGAGALSRHLCSTYPQAQAYLLDLPEVIQAARALYPETAAWSNLTPLAGDFREYHFASDQKFGLILLGNFLHAYEQAEAQLLLQKAVTLLDPDGLLLIHDYFPDRCGTVPEKGALYDLAMMLNTYNGACHDSGRVVIWLRSAGLGAVSIIDLQSDSTVILAQRQGTEDSGGGHPFQEWVYAAMEIGFQQAKVIPITQIATATWVRAKCRYGCPGFGANHQCPPSSMPPEETEKMLSSYQTALLVEGTPPGREFHAQLLRLEKRAFLAGYHKAFAFGAGPCPVCDVCRQDETCRRPDRARPSMEGSGIDVYQTAKNAGLALLPVSEKGRYVKYLGLLLLE